MGDQITTLSADALRGEERAAFARAFRENYPALVTFVRRRVATGAEADDIAQEAYLRVLRYREDKSPEDLRALLFTIATNLIGMRGRGARGRQWVPLQDELILVADAPSPDRQIDGERQIGRLAAVIEKMPSKCQQVFLLRRIHGLTQQQIAERMGISIKAVEKHITTALAICRKKLGQGGHE